MQNENWQAAWFALENVRVFDPENKDLDSYFLSIRLRQENYREAETIAKELLAKNPNDRELWKNFLIILQNLNKEDELFENYIVYAKLFSLENQEKAHLAALYYNAELYRDAASLYAQVEGDLKEDAILKECYSYLALEDYEKAKLVLKKIEAKSEQYYLLSAQINTHLGHDDQAIEELSAALRYNSKNSTTLYSLAQAYDNLKDYDKALNYYQATVNSEIYGISSLLRKSRIYLIKKEPRRALSEAKKALSRDDSQMTKDFYNQILAAQP